MQGYFWSMLFTICLKITRILFYQNDLFEGTVIYTKNIIKDLLFYLWKQFIFLLFDCNRENIP